MLKQKIEPFYNRHYKLGIIFPFVILLISFIIIGQKYSAVGDFMERDVSLKGGLSATLYTDKSIDINGLKIVSLPTLMIDLKKEGGVCMEAYSLLRKTNVQRH